MRLFAAGFALLVVVLAVPVRSDEPIGSSVTFNREVIRIFERKCLQCHTVGAVAMPLGNYRDARLWARAIREELVEQRMPPWRAAPGYGSFTNDIGLTPRERTTILTWADNGGPRGDDRDLPQRSSGPPAPQLVADYTLAVPPQRIPAGETIVRRVTLDAKVVANRALRHVQVVPGEGRVLRAAFVTATSATSAPDQLVGVWTPWLRVLSPPQGAGFRLSDDARLTVELHYVGLDREVDDRSQIALFVGGEQRRIADEFVLDANHSSSHSVPEDAVVLRRDTRVWAIVPSAAGDVDGADGSLEVSAHKVDGTVDVLLWIPSRRHEWPTPYILSEPAVVSAGTTIKVRSTFPTRVRFATDAPSATNEPLRPVVKVPPAFDRRCIAAGVVAPSSNTGSVFSVVAPCHPHPTAQTPGGGDPGRRASSLPVHAGTFTTGRWATRREW